MLQPAINLLAPRSTQRSLAWFRENIQTPDGRPYDERAYPHIGAPGGPCDALDDPQVRGIWLQWASRLGKTFFGQSAQLFYAATRPCPMMFASADQKLAVEVVARLYKMLEKCPSLKEQLRPEHRRKQAQVDLGACRIYVSWARSVSTLADKAVQCGHANEVDKWEHQSTAKEADPLKLFTDRFKEFPSHKRIVEGTPQIRGKSRVEAGRLGSSNCRLYVPCPHCKQYQQVEFERIVWEKLENGRSDVDLARQTAVYRCLNESCEQILDHHRSWQMRRGVWVPEGCGVDSAAAMEAAESWQDGNEPRWRGWRHASWVTGKPFRDGREAGYHLSSLYALSLGWGDLAAEFVASKDRPQYLRNYINQWLANTWEAVERKETWERLAEKWITRTPQGVLPDGHSIVTAGIDKQSDHYVYVFASWGPNQSCHILDYGTTDDVEGVAQLLRMPWRGREDVYTSLALMDSGFRPKEVGDFVRAWNGPSKLGVCKGSNVSLNAPFRVSIQGKGSATPGLPLVLVDTLSTQDWIEAQITGDSGSTTLFAGSVLEHQDFLEQVLNDAAVTKLDNTNNAKLTWDRVSEDIPNDYRDCLRYAFTAMLVTTKCKPINRPSGQSSRPAVKPMGKANFIQRPGGWTKVR